jgi:hypothetical protein
MCSMKRVQLVVLVVVAAGLLAATPASARNVHLTPTVVGDEPGASGEAKLGKISLVGFLITWGGAVPVYSADLSLVCEGLTPGATYYFDVDLDGTSASYPASAAGTWSAENTVCFPPHFSVAVYRVDVLEDGTLQSTCVLAGEFYMHRW